MAMLPGSGRKQSSGRTEVTRIENSLKVRRNYIDTKLKSQIERIRNHLQKCEKRNSIVQPSILVSSNQPKDQNIPIDQQLLIEIDSPSTSQSIDNIRSYIPSPTTPSSSMALASESDSDSSSTASTSSHQISPTSPFNLPPPKKRRLMQPQLSSFAIQTTSKQKKSCDINIAKFFYTNNISFRAAEGKVYKEMISVLRPGYNPPSDRDLSGPLLDEVNDEIENLLKHNLSDSTITLLQDGWSSIKNEPIVATSIFTGTQSFLLNAIDCGSEQKTAEFCAEITEKSIKEVKEKYGKDVFAICTDNEMKMKKMRDIIKSKNLTTITYGCSAHYLNLLEREVIPKTIMKHVVEVQKYFRNHHQPNGWLREKGGLMPQIPNDTRWKSHLACIDTFIKNFYKYVEINNEHDIQESISKILKNLMLYHEAIDLQSILNEVVEALDMLQKDSSNLSTAVDVWIKLYKSNNLTAYKANVKKRMEDALEPFFYVANLLDPNIMGSELSSQQQDEAESWLKLYNHEYFAPFMAFSIKDNSFFPSSMFDETLLRRYKSCPSKWWKIMEKRTSKNNLLPKGFCKFCSDLLSCPPSSASIERVFSTFGPFWSKLRNRLGVQKASKLVKIYKFLNK